MALIKLTALVMAGGRFEGADARAAGHEMKALTEIGGVGMLSGVLAALVAADRVGRILVVGPEEIREVAHEVGAEWALEMDDLLGNVQAGVRELGLTGGKQVLLVGSDLAAPRAQSFDDFIERSPAKASVTTPIVKRAAYERAFPAGPNKFLAIREGEFTMGSQFLSPAGLLLNPPTAVAAILGDRKSQWRMARTFGLPFLFGLLTHTLTIPQLERRASELLGVTARAVPDCAPDLAFDVDNACDLAYARDRFARHLDGR
jgi:GTP:adenosylcobinamide-phosphate guanylyltransferase